MHSFASTICWRTDEKYSKKNIFCKYALLQAWKYVESCMTDPIKPLLNIKLIVKKTKKKTITEQPYSKTKTVPNPYRMLIS